MRRGRHYSDQEAHSFAWGAVTSRWHLDHGERAPVAVCAGCGELISGTEFLELPDGCRVHLADGFACLTRYGERWRCAAELALAEMGLRRPAGVEP
jgi:hypothetical protein